MFADKLPALFQRLPARLRPVVLTVGLGIAAGGAAVLFHLAIHFVYHHGLVALSHARLPVFLVGSFLLVAASSAVSGWLLTRFCPAAAGSGIPQLKVAFWKDFGRVPWRVVWVKFTAGVLSVGGGASLGREGPSVQLAGGLTSNLAGLVGTAPKERRTAAAAGAAAGLAAAFNTPLAAVTFVLEEIIGDLNSRMLGSVLLAAVLGALVAHGLLGAQPAFTLHSPGAPGWLGYALTPLVAVLAAVAGGWFQRLTLGLRARNRRPHRWPAWSRVMLGALAGWALGAAVFATTGHLGVFSLGYEDLSQALDCKLPWNLAALLLVTKLAATALAFGLGGCGGIFAPTLFFGTMAGAALAGLASLALPLTQPDQVALAVVGMSACLGAVVRAPVTGILIVFEMTHEFALVPVLMIGALISQLVGRRMARRNFYEEIIHQDGHALERIMPPRDLRTWMELPVARLANFSPVIVHDLAPAARSEVLARHAYDRFPVVQEERLVGVLTRAEAQRAEREGRAPVLEPAVSAPPDQSLREIAQLIVNSPAGLLVIVEPATQRVLGVVTLHDILRAEMTFARHQAE